MNHLALPHLRTASWARTAAVAVAVLLVCWLVVARSTSAFSATTANGPNPIGTGSVVLDNNLATAMFTVANLKPGPIPPECIEVNYKGTIVGGTNLEPVRLYASATTADLAPYLDLVVEMGPSCTGFSATDTIFSGGTLSDFLSTRGSYNAASATPWTPAGNPETRAFRFSMTVQDDPAAQSKSTDPTFTWEVRTTP